MRWLCCLALECAALAVGTAARAETLAHGWVPSAWVPQGQVQLVEDPEGLRVEILLHSRFMDRIVKSIAEKEQGNWPAGHEDAEAYLRHLREAQRGLDEKRGKSAMKITWVLKPAPGHVTWHTGEVRHDSEGNLAMESPRLLGSFEPSRDYLVRNAALILEDSLKLTPSEVEKLLRDRLPDDTIGQGAAAPPGLSNTSRRVRTDRSAISHRVFGSFAS